MRLARRAVIPAVVGLAALLMGQGCPIVAPTPTPSPGGFNNTTDPTNGGASYIGSAACEACHPDIASEFALHGHGHILNPTEGAPPAFPAQASRAGVPNPPDNLPWDDIAFVIGGYIRKANFVDQQGFLLTTGFNKINSQWDLSFPAAGTVAGFVPFDVGISQLVTYRYSCFGCHTTGSQAFDPAAPQFQEGRPGMAGTFVQAGVQCEACHGPGSNHIPNPPARLEYVNTSAAFCGQCHSRVGPDVIQATPDGFIANYQQYPELLASGGHSGFDCTICHDPHASPNYDLGRAIINQCVSCHPEKNLGFHTGKTYVHGDWVEPLSCVSCHMPFATVSANASVQGQAKGRVGDMHTHIFRISTDPVDYHAFFTPDLSQVAKDAQGRATLTVDFVCLRCHNTQNGFPFILTLNAASEIAAGIHGVQ